MYNTYQFTGPGGSILFYSIINMRVATVYLLFLLAVTDRMLDRRRKRGGEEFAEGFITNANSYSLDGESSTIVSPFRGIVINIYVYI